MLLFHITVQCICVTEQEWGHLCSMQSLRDTGSFMFLSHHYNHHVVVLKREENMEEDFRA